MSNPRPKHLSPTISQYTPETREDRTDSGGNQVSRRRCRGDFRRIVRNHSRGRRTVYLDYTAYELMALRQMEQLAQQALARFAIRDLRILGASPRTITDRRSSVYIAVASAHRAAAFDACRWLIDTLKTTVPIWKRKVGFCRRRCLG